MIPLLKQKSVPWLERIGRYGQIDAFYAARGGFWTSMEFGFSALLSLGLVIAFANLIPKETYGSYKYIMSLGGSIGFLTLTGMNTAVVQSVAKGFSGALPYAVMVQLKWNMLFLVAGLAGATYYLFQGNQTLGYSLILLALSVPFTSALNTYGAFLAGKKNFKLSSIYAAISSTFYALTMVLALYFGKNVVLLVAAYAAANVIPGICFYFRTIRKYQPAGIPKEEKAELIRYGKHLSFINILSTVATYLDKIVVFHYLGATELAVYSLAQAMPERIRGYTKTITGIILPKLSEKDISDIKPVFYKRTFQSMAVGVVMAGGYILLSPFVFRFFLPQYLESTLYSQVIALSLVMTMPATYMSSVFRSQKLLRTIYLSSITANIFRIVALVVLGALWGIWGVIIAMHLVYVLGFFYNVFLWESEIKKHGSSSHRHGNPDENPPSEESGPKSVE